MKGLEGGGKEFTVEQRSAALAKEGKKANVAGQETGNDHAGLAQATEEETWTESCTEAKGSSL